MEFPGMMASIVGVKVVIAAVIAVLIVLSMDRRGRRGGNRDATLCPRCRSTMPVLRSPSRTRQLLWGGWTCPGCGCELDKRGRELVK